MNVATATCRTCGSTETSNQGALPDVDVFAGRRLEAALPGGYLHRCRACGFVFRAPVLTGAAYNALYAGGGAEVWEQNHDREDFRLVRAALANTPLDVLDVGCYSGDLLASLPAGGRRDGVEPGPAAAAMATARGVEVVAQSWDQLDGGTRLYDVVVSCDVIEHVPDPLAFLRSLGRRLKPDGRLIVTTGNSQAWPWRLARSRFWYCYFPEHISFIDPLWLRRMAPAAGLRVQRLDPFAHSPLPGLAARARALLATCAWLVARPRSGHAKLLGGGIARDHMFCILAKD